MGIDRRAFLAGAAAGVVTWPGRAAGRALPAIAATTARLGDGRFALIGIAASGAIAFEAPLPGRGHGLAVHPARPLIAAFGRRPGRWTALFDARGGHLVQIVVPPADHFFTGHGFFLPDGAILAMVEIALPRGEGRIGLYDAQARFRRFGEFSTFGIGAHEAVLLGDGATIAVANGGLLPDPGTGGDLKPYRMAPEGSCVVLLDARSGQRLASVSAPETQADFGYRHLAAMGAQFLAVGLQALDPARAPALPSLARLVTREGRQRWLAPGDPLWSGLGNYVGSIVWREGTLAFTSPRGGRAILLDPARDEVLRIEAAIDICGVAPVAPGTFLLTSGLGAISTLARTSGAHALRALPGYQFDNHAVALNR